MRPRQEKCKRGHCLADAHVAQTVKGIKRTCKKCRYLRHKSYYGIGEIKCLAQVNTNPPASANFYI